MASIDPTNQTTNEITWIIPDLDLFESETIEIQVSTNVAATVGDTVVYSASIEASMQDDVVNNNSEIIRTVISDSQISNVKLCSREALVTPVQLANNNEFEYLICFQNTQTQNAENVLIRDTISSFFDMSTFRIIASKRYHARYL